MKKFSLIFTFILLGCSTTSDVIKIGRNSYTINVSHTTIGSGLSSHGELRDEGLKKASEFCRARNLDLHLDSAVSAGEAGWGSIDDTINFSCLPKELSDGITVIQMPSNPHDEIELMK